MEFKLNSFSKYFNLAKRVQLNVIYRVCDSVQVCSGVRKRCFEASKTQLVEKCLQTLKINIENLDIDFFDFTLYCIVDNCSVQTINNLKNLHSNVSLIYPETHGNANSFCKCIELALNFDDPFSICYFLEDDYLFLKDDSLNRIAFSMLFLTQHFNRNCAIMPDDYPDRYQNSEKNAQIIQIPTGNYMRIYHTTCTFIVFQNTVEKYKQYFLNFSKWPMVSEDQSVNVTWKDVPLFQPLDALTLHSQSKSIIPQYLDFNKINNYIKN